MSTTVSFSNTDGPNQRNTEAIDKINELLNCGKSEVKGDPKFIVNIDI